MKYIVSYSQPNHHYIDIEYIIDNVNSETLQVQLPAWRPGRYELGNFAKNIQKWQAFDEKGNALPSKKIKKDLWEIATGGISCIHIRYNYFANEINAGSSYLSDQQLYINGVNCFLYIPERINEACNLDLILPEDYRVASGLKAIEKHKFIAKDFHELVDCPLIASNTIQHKEYTESGVKFHLWFQGECKPDWQLLENDFRKFCKNQIESMGDFPVNEYHFLFQILTYRMYHGVEHYNSTVITLGPSYDIMRKEGWYNELLGVSSHELYHTWNVKQIRPVEMYPYDYSKENYTVLGYLDEGVTTYYGDKFLFSSGVFDWEQYAKTFVQLLEKHYYNFGVNNYSVAQSSFDTWLDGYVKGTPGRKGSIYTEGALIAFMTDIFILENTNNQHSLIDVMKYLYNEYAKKGSGVSDRDYKNTVEKIAGCSFDTIYHNFIHGTNDYTPGLKKALDYVGCELKTKPSLNINESKLGFKVRYENNACLVDNIFPGSVADIRGLAINDEIIAINNIKVINDLELWANYFFKENSINFLIKKELEKVTSVSLTISSEDYFMNYRLIKKEKLNGNEMQNFNAWRTMSK